MKFGGIKLMVLGAIAILTSCTANQSIQTTKKTITIGGSAEAYEVIQVLTKAYEAQTETIEFKFLNSSQTSGGVQGVKDGVLDIGLTSRELTEAEQDDGIQYRAIARNPMLLVTNSSVGAVTNITTEQIKAIYGGQIDNWQKLGGQDAEIIILDLPEDETDKQLIRESYLKDSKITSRAILIPDDDLVLDALTATPDSIGTVPKGQEVKKSPVKILTIDGISPTTENIRNGKYKLVYKIGIVFTVEPAPATEQFIKYIFSEAGKQKLTAAGYVAIDRP